MTIYKDFPQWSIYEVSCIFYANLKSLSLFQNETFELDQEETNP